MAASEELFRYMAYPGFERWFAHAVAVEDQVPFVVLRDDAVIGSTRYANADPEHRRVEIGWTWMVRSQWGNGTNIETKLLLCEHAFERWGAMRVEFKTDARNLRVRGALLGIGCTFEGIARKHMIVGAGVRDSAWYAIVDDDWPAAKARMLAKLEPHL